MKIVIDSNILFSALIKDSKTRELILEYQGSFLFPSFIFTEFQRYKGELLNKSGMTKNDFDDLINLIIKKMDIIPERDLVLFKEEALEIIKDIDVNDVTFIACALAFPQSLIWSDDRKLKKQKSIKVLNTSEIVDFLRKQG